MMNRYLVLGALVAALAAPGVAMAGPTCTDGDRTKWMSEDAMKAKIAQLGYNKIDVFKASRGHCYEIYGYAADGSKVEVYFHPVTGAVMEINARK